MSRAKASMLAGLTAILAAVIMFSMPYSPAQVVQTVVIPQAEWADTVLVGGVVSYVQQPYAALQTGMVAQVYAKPGQRIQKGDLLFQMDVSAQQQALAVIKNARYQQKKALLNDGELAAAVAAVRELEWSEMETKLLSQIEMAQIRAQNDGVMEAVYAEQGQFVSAETLLGTVRDEEKSIIVSSRADRLTEVKAGMTAFLMQDEEMLSEATVKKLTSPDASGMQQMMIQPENADDLEKYTAGERVTVKVVKGTVDDCALLPLSAIDEEGKAWFVLDGRVHCEKVEILLLDRDMAAAEKKWVGRRVIRNPDGLNEGCRVKEAVMQ